MERKFLERFGMDKEAIDQIMRVNGEDIERHKRRALAAEEAASEMKTQLAEVKAQLEPFEGIDVAGLQSEVSGLQAELEGRQAEFDRRLAEERLHGMLEREGAALGAHNMKAVAALLDMEALRGSETPEADMRQAMQNLLQSDAYLFEGAASTPLCVSTGAAHSEPGSTEVDAFTWAALRGAGLSKAEE